MKRRKPDMLVLFDLIAARTPDKVAAVIAAELRAGPSPQFCRVLAEMVDPKGCRAPLSSPWRLKPQRRGGRRGPSKADRSIGVAMVTLIDDQGMSLDKAIYETQKQFGSKRNSRSKLLAALKAEREFREQVASEWAREHLVQN